LVTSCDATFTADAGAASLTDTTSLTLDFVVVVVVVADVAAAAVVVVDVVADAFTSSLIASVSPSFSSSKSQVNKYCLTCNC